MLSTQIQAAPSVTFKLSTTLKLQLAILAFFLVFYNLAPPEGLTEQTWHLFAIFVTTIISIILKPLPMGALAVLGIAVCTITNTLTIEQSLTSFSSKTVWLVVSAFLLARGFIKTGLGARLAYLFVYFTGRTTIGLGYSLTLTELLLAPFIPSNTARGAGIIFPIASSLAREYNSNPDNDSQDLIGSYLIKLCFHANIITSAMFLTAMAANPLIAVFASDLGFELTWTLWAKAAIVPGIINLMLLPIVLYYLIKPKITKTPDAKKIALEKLEKMGKIKSSEYIMLFTFILLLTLWVCGPQFKIAATTAAFLGLSILLLTNVLTWEDVLQEKNAWNTFIWLATLLMMTTYLAKFGMITWFSDNLNQYVAGFNWLIASVILVLVYFYSHYFFASLTAHVSTMYTAFVVLATATGSPLGLGILLFAFFSNLSASITHYGTGTAPVYFGANYVSLKKWWQIGFVISLINILIWFIVGGTWWKFIGLW